MTSEGRQRWACKHPQHKGWEKLVQACEGYHGVLIMAGVDLLCRDKVRGMDISNFPGWEWRLDFGRVVVTSAQKWAMFGAEEMLVPSGMRVKLVDSGLYWPGKTWSKH